MAFSISYQFYFTTHGLLESVCMYLPYTFQKCFQSKVTPTNCLLTLKVHVVSVLGAYKRNIKLRGNSTETEKKKHWTTFQGIT